jgi:hypothetical protein
MSRPKTRHDELAEMLVAAGFDGGWVLVGETLTVWEHDENPPAPLTRPTE